MKRHFSIVFFAFVLALFFMPRQASAITECCCRYTNGVNTGTCEFIDRAIDETCASYKNSEEWKTSDNANFCSTSTKPEPKKKNPIIFIPNISIPGSDIFVKGGSVTVNGRFIGDYVSAIYSFLAGVIAMIAAVMILYGGFQWMTASGNAGNVQKAKTTIYSSLIAIVLTLGSYLLLYTINPQLVQIRDLSLLTVPGIDTTVGTTCASSAQAILHSGKVFFPSGFSCESQNPKTTASAEIHDLAANTTCTMTALKSNACGDEHQVNADANLINGLGELALKCGYGMNTIGGAIHGATSNHYQGKAADIEIRDTGYGDCAQDIVTSIFCPKGVHVNKETSGGSSWIHLGPDVGKSADFLDLCSS